MLICHKSRDGWQSARLPEPEVPEGTQVPPGIPQGGDWHIVGRGPDGERCILASCLTLAEAEAWRTRFAGCACGSVRIERHVGEARDTNLARNRKGSES